MSLLDNLKKIKNAAQLATTAAEGTNPVGWAMIIAKYRKQIMKAMAAGIGLFILLLLALWQKFVGAALGLAFGVVTGLPLLLVPGVGPFLYAGWVAYWGYRGWTHPIETIHLATHPWEIATTPISKAWGYLSSGVSKGWNYSVSHLEGTPNAVGSTISGGLAGFGHWVTGLGSSLINGAVSLGGSFLGGLVDIGSSALGYLTGATGAVAGQIAAVAVGTTIASAATLAILNAGILTPGKFATTQLDKNPYSQNKPPLNVSPYGSVQKLVSIPSLSLGPASFIQIGNNQVPQNLSYDITVKATVDISSITCEDRAALVKTDGTIVNIPIPPIPQAPIDCPTQLSANQTYSHTFSLQIPDPADTNLADYQDAVIFNKFILNGTSTSLGGNTNGLTYWIPLHDKILNNAQVAATKSYAEANYTNSLVNAPCPGGQTCWDYVISQSQAANINPSFVLAVWGEESHYSDIGNHLSCPASIIQPHDGTGLSNSLDCFLNIIIDSVPNTADGFIEAMNHYCGTGPWSPDPTNPEPLCSNNPNFFKNVQGIYQQLGATTNPLPSIGSTSTPFDVSSVATVKIGAGSTNPSNPSGWPTCGSISQGPYSDPPGSHSSPPYQSSIDIDNNQGTKIYASHNGTIIAEQPDQYGGLYVGIRGDNYISYYVHLLSFNPDIAVGQQITAGTLVGYMDHTGIANQDHLHYMIRDINNVQISLAEFNSLLPPYRVGDTVTSTWGACQ